MLNRTIIPALAGLFFVATAAMAQPAANTVTTTYNLPQVGLAPSETLQVDVVNTAAAAGNGTAVSCSGSPSPYMVGTDQISSIKLLYASAAPAGSRTVVRAVITSTAAMPMKAPCSLGYSLETYDTATGATHVYVASATSVVPSGPEPTPPAPPAPR